MSYLDKLQRFELSGTGSTPRHNDIAIELAAPNARPVFWERADGLICGPATPEFRARVSSGPKIIYLVVAQFLGEPVFINSTALRSQVQFETQPPLRTVEPIREPQ